MATTLLSIYGAVLFVGAFIGFKAGSKISLIMGLVSGAIVFLGIYLSGQNPKLGFGIISGISAVLVVQFLIRLIQTSKMMPSGMLLLLSLAALIVAVLEFIKK